MRCDAVRARLSHGDITEAERAAIDRHLRTCTGCTAFNAFLVRMTERLRANTPPGPPPYLAARIRATLGLTADNAPAGDAPAKEKRMPRILAVDDEPNIVRLIQVNLERAGYQVETANNGAQALAKLRQSMPDLLVSDVMMPEMDGFELLKNVRMDAALADLPVIMLTAKTQDLDIMRGYSHGADMYLTKPFNPQELLSFVKRVLASVNGSDDGSYRL